GRSVRPVCWPERVQAVLPCRAMYTIGSLPLVESSPSVCCTHGCGNADKFPALRCDGPVFLSANHQDSDPRIWTGDIGIEFGPGIQLAIEFDSEKSQRAACGRSYIGRVLTHPSSKYQ